VSVFLKPLIVLIISALLFFGLLFLADREELLEYVQTSLYNPSIEKSILNETVKDAELIEKYIAGLQERFSSSLNEPSIRGSFLHNQSAADIFERSKTFGTLLETVSGLQTVQFVDDNGMRIHYSTSNRDIISQDSSSTAYRNYTDDARALPYEAVKVPAYGNPNFVMDESRESIIFSFPFSDSMDVYRGTALFTLSVRALSEMLIGDGRLKANESVSVIRLPPGIVFGSPEVSKKDIFYKVSAIWDDGLEEHVVFNAEETGVKLALFSAKTSQGIFYGRLVNESLFAIPEQMIIILKVSIFVTFFLILFFLVNFKPDAATLVHNRLRNLKANLFEQLYINKNGYERARWIFELEQRREEIRADLKHGLKMGRGRNSEKNIDSLINKIWDELLAVMKIGSGYINMPVNIPAAQPVQRAESISSLEEID